MSIKTDKIFEAQCNLPEDCKADASVVTNQDCNDPAFAAANPELCDNHPEDFPKLILKPGSVCVGLLGTVTFRVFAYNNGVETEVLQGLTYRSSNNQVAIVGVTGGVATGLTSGIATIAVEWQDMTAYAQLTVVDDATDTAHVGTALMVDNSKSMGLGFGLAFSSKLAFAKQAAFQYASELNISKDTIALYRFNTGAFPIDLLTNNKAGLKAHATAIPSSTESTNLADAISDAASYLNSQSLDRRVIVLLTDGENKQGPNPVPFAESFKASGGVIVVMGVRAHGEGFKLLEKIATGGFFLNATVLNYTEVLEQLSGLKGYLCAGNCTPAGDVTLGLPQLNYEGFINWDAPIVDGPVDLIGGTPPYAKYDFLPGNGLYIDLAGSGAPWKGKMTLKDSVKPTLAADDYELSLYLAGNQREDVAGARVRVRLWVTDPDLPEIDVTISMDDWKQDFTQFLYVFTGSGVMSMIVELTEYPGLPFFGPLLDRISVRKISDDTIVFEDNFDGENSFFIPPGSTLGTNPFLTEIVPDTGYGYGYDDYGAGCLTTPPGETVQDTDPPPDIE